MFLARQDEFLDEDVSMGSSGMVATPSTTALPSWHGLDVEILSRAKVDTALPCHGGFSWQRCAVVGSWKVASERKSSLTAALTERAIMKLGGGLAAVRQRFNHQGVRDMISSGTAPSEQQLWRQSGPYTFAAEQFKEGKESTGYTSISDVSGAEVTKLGSTTLAPNLPEHTCVSK
jgi:hypothetical protein